jgi:hypothetical protein
MSRRLAGFGTAAILQVAAVVLAHELVFLARYGSRFGEALVHSGHGQTWTAAITTSMSLGAGLAAFAAIRLARLGLLVRRREAVDGRGHGALDARALLRTWLRIGPRLAIAGAVLLSIQENVERALIGAPMPGPGVLLTPEYAGGLWIALAVGLAVGLVAAMFGWHRRALLERLRSTSRPPRRVTSTRARRPGVLVTLPADSLLGRRSGLRAPPSRVAVLPA